MAEKKSSEKKGTSNKKSGYYKVSGDKVERLRRHCPKCGPGVFLGEHANRTTCGKCRYTEFKKK
jgi:small subunit ribosomal protein S27Ae